LIKESEMTARNELEAWKVFLKGRILQEQGNNQEALGFYEKALAIDPNNASFLNAKAAALRAMGKGVEGTIARVKSQYRQLADTLVADKDKPEDWIRGLESISGEVDRVESVAPEAIGVAW
jgi:tetratricopeptide (TPR) repeat protein